MLHHLAGATIQIANLVNYNCHLSCKMAGSRSNCVSRGGGGVGGECGGCTICDFLGGPDPQFPPSLWSRERLI